ncbi:K02A2.6-like [Cordylochernes scorpioides]|uniref:K02A2.6-like n=1 Tax=Cordylochernes scorpioides TaxID=51811 RepID=A0ABY6KB55_9ARAC|nr:K02A2.6-like [Cordylochernes scorpioides]
MLTPRVIGNSPRDRDRGHDTNLDAYPRDMEEEPVIIDHPSRYIWACPTASNNPAAIINILRQLLSSGVPIKRILTDKETETKWSTLVPFIVNTYNQTPHEVTKFSPKFLLYGIDESPSFADHPITLEEARGLARENTRKAQIKRKNHHDDKHPDVEFSEGDQVMRTVAKHHPCMSKLSPRQGPFFVKKKISSLVYDIQDTEGRVYRAHASQLRSFNDRDSVFTHRQF